MVVIITGSTGGIGRCVAECAVKSSEVDKVYCMYRNEQKLNQWKYAGHPKVIPVWHDGCDPGEYTKLLQVLDDLQPDRIAYIHTAFQIKAFAGRQNSFGIIIIWECCAARMQSQGICLKDLLRVGTQSSSARGIRDAEYGGVF